MEHMIQRDKSGLGATPLADLGRPAFGIFLLVFVVVFSTLKLGTNSGSNGNVEQWMNLTNQTLYGSQDFLFSYGPLYWLVGGVATPYSVYTYWLAIAFLSAVCGAFWSMLATLLYRSGAYVLPAIAFFLIFGSLNFSAALFLWPFLAVACLDSRNDRESISPKLLAVLGALVGFFVYIRFFYGLAASAAIGSYLLYRMFSMRQAREVVVFVAVSIAVYVLLGLVIFQDHASIVNYLLINKNLSFGNSVDMTLDVQNSGRTFVVAAAVAVLLNAYLLLRRRSMLLTVNVLLLLFFKLGFSRTDHYIPYFVVSVAVLALVMLFERGMLGRILYALSIAGLYYIAITPSYPGAPVRMSHVPAVDFNVDYQQRMQGVYNSAFSLGDDVRSIVGQSTIDFYPYNNEYAFANGLNYKHRPSFQNYMTLTPALDRMNKAFFESADRPRYVLWSSGIACRFDGCNVFDGFDQKYSLSEDPLTSTAILLNYHSVGVFHDASGVPFMLLEENAKAEPYVERNLGETPMTFGKWYSVPSGGSGIVKFVPDLKLTWYGRVKNLLFRGNVLKVSYKLASGEIREYRVNIINAQSGIWVSPYLSDFSLQGMRVEAVMLTPDSSRYLKPEFEARWVSVEVDAVRSKAVDLSRVEDSVAKAKSEVRTTCDGSLDVINNIAPLPASVELSGLAKVQGWLVASSQKGILMDETYLSITDSKGERTFIATSTEGRPDLVNAFKHPSMLKGGFSALIDLSERHGNYRLGLAGLKGTVLYTCDQFSVPLEVK